MGSGGISGIRGEIGIIGVGANLDVKMGLNHGRRMARPPLFYTCETAGATVGMGAEWCRRQIIAGRMRATAFDTGRRRAYRIRADDWAAFLAKYTAQTDDPNWE